MNSILKIVTESIDLKKSFFNHNDELIYTVANEIRLAILRGNKVLIFGNGGSAADAQHIAAEFVGKFQRMRLPLPAIALTTDSSILTSIGNDFGFDQVFVRQVLALGTAGDIAIAISTSGNSPNVIKAVDMALQIGMITIAFTGQDGGVLGEKAYYHLNVPHKVTARVQEVHIMLGHILCDLVDDVARLT